ncbi:nitroreductase family protein [Thiomonas sp. FB-Cd]|uniref:nitroreductase family protein n=1 Tax=Thiomonas sp. FB-Cd TaxID=1158292 RepID=UPI001E3E9C52|nr:nitroreductase family protein [Thiomonas sp. FB-Cd]
MAEKWNAASLSAAAPTPNAQAKTPATAHAPVGGTSASAMLTLARRKNCLTCHTADHKVVGPAYEAVAEKYAGKPGAEQMLVNAVLHGHVGTWGQVPMPAEPGTNSIELPSAYFDFPMSNAMTLAEPIDYAELICELVRKRQQTSPKRLGEPGPDAGQVRELFTAAAQAPDHGLILPWRFVHVSDAGRQRLGEAFVQALLERDPDATAQQRSEARAKAARAPFLALAIARPHDDASPEIPPRERLVSLGCALQNMLLLAHAQGFGAGLVSGQAMESRALRDLFRLADNEQAVCFIAVGTVAKAKTSRVRPSPVDFVETL